MVGFTSIKRCWSHRTFIRLRSSLLGCEWLLQQPGIFTVYTLHQLKQGISEDEVLGQRVLRSYYPERCGDVLIVLKPNWLLGEQYIRNNARVPRTVMIPTYRC